MNRNATGAAVIDKMLDVAELVAGAADGMSASEIADRTGLPRPTVYRLLSALARRGYLVVGPDRRIRIGLSFMRLGSRVHIVDSLSEVGRPLLWDLVKETSCSSAQIAVLSETVAAFVERASLPGTSFQLDRRPGDFVPLYCTALGKVLLAQLPIEEARALLGVVEFEKRTPSTPIDPDAVMAELVETRRQGYATSVAEYSDDVWSVAAALPLGVSGVRLAVGISEHMWRYSPQRLHSVAHSVAQAAARLGAALADRARQSDADTGPFGTEEDEVLS